MVYSALNIKSEYLCKKNRQRRVHHQQAPCHTLNMVDLRKADTTDRLTAINRARAVETECLRARPNLHKADRLYCSIWPMRWKSSRMVPRGNEFNNFEIGRAGSQIEIGRSLPFVKSSFSMIYVHSWRWWDVATSFPYRKCGTDCWPITSMVFGIKLLQSTLIIHNKWEISEMVEIEVK